MLPFACLLPVLVLVAWRDVTTRTIPDAASMLLAVTGVAFRLLDGPEALLLSLLSAALLFAVLLFLFARGALGGGDVKLMSALALGMAPSALWDFLVITAAAGGVLGLTYLALSRLLPAQPARRAAGGLLPRLGRVEAWRIRRRGPLPYGVAIAFGAAMILLRGM